MKHPPGMRGDIDQFRRVMRVVSHRSADFGLRRALGRAGSRSGERVSEGSRPHDGRQIDVDEGVRGSSSDEVFYGCG